MGERRDGAAEGRSAPVNRVTTWILGTISGLLLAFVALALTVRAGGYGVSAGCVSTTDQPCTPIVQQVSVSLPWATAMATFPSVLLLLAILIGLPAWIATPILAIRRGSSARAAILVVSVIATALLIVSAVTIPLSSEVFSAPEVCLASNAMSATSSMSMDQAQTCFTGQQAFWVALIGVSWGPIALTLIMSMPAWVMTLTQTARWRQWGWFVAALLFSPVAALLYAFFGAGRPTPPAPVAPVTPPAPAPAM